MGSLTHSRRTNRRVTPHHIPCPSRRCGFSDDPLPKAVLGLAANAGGTLCSIVPTVSGHIRWRGTGPGPPGARTVSRGDADSDSSMLLTHPCSEPDARAGVLGRPCAQPSAPVERDTPVPFPIPAQDRPCSAWHSDGPCSMFLGTVLVLSRRQTHHHTPRNMPSIDSNDSPRDSAYKDHITLWRAPQCPIAPEILRSTFGHNLSVSESRVPVAALFLTSPSRPTMLHKIENLVSEVYSAPIVRQLPGCKNHEVTGHTRQGLLLPDGANQIEQ